MHINYTALRALLSTHTATTTYDLDFNPERATQGRMMEGTELRSIGGATDVTVLRTEVKYRISTLPLLVDDLTENIAGYGWWQEFLASTDRREEFTFDLWGTSASPDNPILVRRDGPASHTTSQRDSAYVTVSFMIRFVE